MTPTIITKYIHIYVSILILSMVALLVLGAGAERTEGAFNEQINYQGKLTDSSGSTVADGTYHMMFRLYTTAGGATTTNIWEGDRSTAPGNRVTVTNGLFSVMLGSSTALSSVDFDQTLYLGVEVGGSGGSPSWDGEMTPRKVLGAVPAAFEAGRVDGLEGAQFLRSDDSDTLASTSASTLLTINQSGTGDVINLLDGGSEVFTVLDGGNVGIGSSSPSSRLTVAGETVADYFTATSTSATSTLPLLAVTDLAISGAFFDGNAAAGANGQILQSTGSGTQWVATSSLGISDTTLSESEVEAFIFDADNSGTLSSGTLALDSLSFSGTLDDAYVNDALTISGGGINDTPIGTATPSTGVFTNATTTQATSTNLYVSNAFTLNGDRIIDITGVGLTVTNGALTVASTSLGLGDGTFLGLTDTQSSFTANRIPFTNSGGTALTDSSALTFDGTNLGIGSTTPSGRLVVSGETIGEYFTATSTTASSTLPLLSVTDLAIAGTFFDTNGDAGTNGQILSSTGSATQWISTSSLAINTDNLVEGSNLFYTDTRVASYINSSSTIWNDNTEASLESFLSGVTDVFTNNDGALSDDDLSNNTIAQLSDVAAANVSGSLLYYDGADWDDIATNSLNIAISDTVGTLAATRGGTGLSTVTQDQLLIGGAGNTWSQVATSSLGLGDNTFLGLTDTQSSFTANRIPFTNSGGTALTDTANFVFTGSNLGIGTTSPNSLLALEAIVSPQIILRDTTNGAVGTLTQGDTNLTLANEYSGGLVFQTNSSEVGRFTSTGRLGLGGETSPNSTLSVAGNVAIGATYAGNDTAPSSGLLVEGTVGIGTSSPSSKLSVGGGDLYVDGNIIGSDLTATGTVTFSNALGETSGGTGQSTYSAGDVLYASGADTLTRLSAGADGTVLKLSGGVPTWGADNTGGAGGSGVWATTSDDLAIYPSDTSDVVIVGASATTTTGNILEVVGASLFDSLTADGTLTLSGSAANIALGSNFISGDGDDEGISVNSNGSVGINISSHVDELEVASTSDAVIKVVTADSTAGAIASVEFVTEGGANRPKSAIIAEKINGSDSRNSLHFAVNTNDNTSHVGVSDARLTVDGLTGYVGIGTTSPSQELSIDGDIYATGGFVDSSGTFGTSGQILQTTGSATQWTATSSLGLGDNTFLGLTDTQSSFTANRIPFTNGGGTALTDAEDLVFDGTSLGVGTATPNANVHIFGGQSGQGSVTGTAAGLIIERNNSTGLTILTPSNDQGNIYFGDESGTGRGRIVYDHDTDNLSLYAASNERLTIDSSGNVGIGSSTPSSKLVVSGETTGEYFTATSTTASSTLPLLTVTDFAIGGAFFDGNGEAGTNGQILSSTGSGSDWIATSSLGLGDNTFLGLKDTGSSFTANRIPFTNSGGTALTDAADFVFTGSNLGIGTTSPNSLLALEAAVNPRITLRDTTNGAVGTLTQGDSNLILANTYSGGLVFQTDGSEVGRFTSAGRLGLGGEGSPDSILSVAGNAAIGSTYAGSNGAPSNGLLVEGTVGIGTSSPVSKLHIWDTSDVAATLRSQSGDAELEIVRGDVNDWGWVEFRTDANSSANWYVGLDDDGTNNFTIGDGGNQYLTIVDTGSTPLSGIGTSSPWQEFGVEGDISVTGAYYDSTGSAGVNGQVLLTTGSATQWTATSSLGLDFGDGTFLGLSDTPNSFTANRIPFTNSGASSLTDSDSLVFTGTNLGIGDSTPAAALTVGDGDDFQVSSTGIVSIPNGSDLAPAIQFVSDDDTGLYLADTNALGVVANGAEVLRIGSTGDISFNADTNTFISRPASDTLTFTTGNSERLRIDSGGQVGIGTSTMTAQLHLWDESLVDAIVESKSAGARLTIERGDVTAVGHIRYRTDGLLTWTAGPTTDSDENFAISDGGNQFFTIVDNGTTANVGVGTTSPAYMFVAGRDATEALYVGDQDGVSIWGDNANPAPAALKVYADDDGSQEDRAFEVFGVSDPDAKDITSATSRFVVLSGGEVGVGTTSPSQELSVAGDIYATGGIVDSTGTLGTSGQILQTTGSATQWTATSSLGLGDGTFLGLKDTPGSFTTNSIPYESSGALAFSSNFVYNGTGLGIGGVSPSVLLEVSTSDSGVTPNASANEALFERDGVAGITIGSNDANSGHLYFGDTADASAGRITYNHATDELSLWAGGNRTLNVASTTRVGIGTQNPSGKLHVNNNWADTTNGLFVVDGFDNETEAIALQVTDENDNEVFHVRSGGSGNADTGIVYVGGTLSVGTSSPNSSNLFTFETDSGLGGILLRNRQRIDRESQITVTTDGYLQMTTDTIMDLGLTGAAVDTQMLRFQANSLTVNNAGDANNFTVEGDTDTHLLRVEGTLERVGVSTSSPSHMFSVEGDIYATGGIVDSTGTLGTSGQILQTTGSATQWTATSSLGLGDGTFLGLKDTGSSFTANSIPFTNSGGTALTDVSNFVFDGTNLGVGTSAPNAMLDVDGEARFVDDALRVTGWNSGNTDIDGLILGSSFGALVQGDANAHLTFALRENGSTDGFSFITGGGDYATDPTYDTLGLWIGGNGRVSIADDSPDYKLEVVGAAGNGYFGLTNSTDGDIFAVDSNGRVGIGTSTPGGAAELAIDGSGTVNQTIRSSDGNTALALDRGDTGDSSVLTFATANSVDWYAGTVAGDSDFRITDSAVNEMFRIVDNGSTPLVGIGTSSPAYEFTVEVGSGNAEALYVGDQSGVSIWGDNGNPAPAALKVYADNDGSQNDRAFEVFGVSNPDDKDISDATSRFVVMSAGEVGVSTTSPSQELSVTGDIYATGGFVDSSGTFGTSGQILQTTGSATQWTATSSLGLGDNTFLGLKDTGSSFTAERIPFTNSGGTALTDTANFVFDGTNLGVGTSTPDTLLDVYGNVRGQRFTSLNSGGSAAFLFEREDGSVQGSDTQGAVFLFGAGTQNAASVFDNQHRWELIAADRDDVTSFDLSGGATSTRMLVVNPSVGNGGVAIGDDTTPDLRLEVFGKSTDGFFGVSTVANGDGDLFLIDEAGRIAINDTTPNFNFSVGSSTGPASGGWFAVSQDSNADIFVVDGNGGVGIGEISPEFSLEIATTTADGYFAISDTAGGEGDLFLVDTSGTVGIGENAPSYNLEISGTATSGGWFAISDSLNGDILEINSSGNLGINDNSPSEAKLVVGGDIYALTLSAVGNDPLCWDGTGGSVIGDCSSLAEYKDNIEDLSVGLTELLALTPREFDWNLGEKDDHDIGFIAEEVAAVSPLLAEYDEDGTLNGVKYARLSALIVKSIQEQQLTLDELITASSSINMTGEDDTFWNRLAELVGSFVDGTLSILKIDVDQANVREELCVDDVCVDADDLRALLELTDDADPGSSHGGGDSGTGDDEDTDGGSGGSSGGSSDDGSSGDGSDDTASSTDDGGDVIEEEETETTTDEGTETEEESTEETETTEETTEEATEEETVEEETPEETVEEEETEEPEEDPEPEPEPASEEEPTPDPEA